MSDNTRRRTSLGRDGNRLREFVFLTDELSARSIRRPPSHKCVEDARKTRLWLRRATFAVRRMACQPKLRSSEDWWSQTESNRRPPACKAGALPTELWPQVGGRPPSLKRRRATFAVRRLACQPKRLWPRRLVGLGRFELPTSRLSSARSNQLSYRPKKHTLAPRCL